MAGNTIWTIQKLLTWTTGYFRRHGIEEPRLDAELLLAHVFHKSRMFLYTDFDLIVEPDELAVFRDYVKKRVAGFSVAAITGEKDFMDLTFAVDDHVLIPRPDTETWLEKVIQYHRGDGAISVADLGIGSGCILLSFLYYCKEAKGVGVDISEEALAVAEKNAEKLQLSSRVEFRKGDFLSALKGEEIFDGILSNPPYIPHGDLAALQTEVQHEPLLALDGGADGLDFYRKLAEGAAVHLKPGGFIAMEFGIHQAGDVKQLFEETGAYTDFEVIEDYGHIERALYARKKTE